MQSIDQGWRNRDFISKDLAFGYRHSAIQDSGAVVLSAKFALSPGNYETINQEMERLTHLRELKQPLEYPSCGSVFKTSGWTFCRAINLRSWFEGLPYRWCRSLRKTCRIYDNVADGTARDYEDLIESVIEKLKNIQVLP